MVLNIVWSAISLGLQRASILPVPVDSPELDWHHHKGRIERSISELADLLGPSGFMPTQVDLIAEGLANTNYVVSNASGEKAVLRIVQRSVEGLAVEVAAMRSVQVPIPEILFVDFEKHVLLTRFVEGETLQRTMRSAEARAVIGFAHELGVTLGRIASTKFEQAGFLGSDMAVATSFVSVYDGLTGFMKVVTSNKVARSRRPDLLDRTHTEWVRHEDQIRASTQQPNLSHGDFKPSNIVVHEGNVAAVLDWEFVHSGTWLLDAGQMLRYTGAERNAFALDFEAGLQSAGVNPPPDWDRLARVIDLMSLCDFLGKEASGDAEVSSVAHLIEQSLAILDLVE